MRRMAAVTAVGVDRAMEFVFCDFDCPRLSKMYVHICVVPMLHDRMLVPLEKARVRSLFNFAKRIIMLTIGNAFWPFRHLVV